VTVDRGSLAKRVQERALLTGHFRLRSGTSSEKYFDKYLLESDPALLRELAEALALLMPSDVDALAGLEMGGIPLVTLLGQVTGLQTLFVRKAAKEYGTCRLAEGGEVMGRRLVVIEDVVTSGGQLLMSCAELRRSGADLAVVLCLIDRERGGREALAADDLELRSLFTATALEAA